MGRRKKKITKKNYKVFIALLLVVVLLAGIGFICYNTVEPVRIYVDAVIQKLRGEDEVVSGELEIHFVDLGEKTGDCIYIKVGNTDIIVDSGPIRASSSTIYSYLSETHNFVSDGILEYVIVTHADQDHIAGFAGSSSNPSLFERYECKTIIDFPKTNKTTQIYNDYITKRNAEVETGAKRYSALECYNESVSGAKRKYALSESVELEILYNYYYEYENADENNYSVCFLINQGSRHFLFTGDLEKSGEEKLVENNTLPQVELFKAGHHGSKTSSNDVLLNVIKPKICVVTCVAGSCEYTNIKENMFPTQAFCDRIAKQTTKVYVTGLATLVPEYETDGVTPKLDSNGRQEYDIASTGPLNGNIVVSSTSDTDVSVNCSANNTLLKDTTWFKQNRSMPTQWAA